MPEGFETKVSWDQFCEFHAKRTAAVRELESLYGDYIEDEREREGRLFRRWCSLVLEGTKRSRQNSRSDDHPGGGLEQKAVSDVFKGSKEAPAASTDRSHTLSPEDLGLDRANQANPTAEKMSAKSIVAFVSYFTVNVIADKYNIGADSRDALNLLTEALVYVDGGVHASDG